MLPPPIIHRLNGDLPVLLSVPHSGRDYPGWLVELSARGAASLEALEDPFVDRLVWRAMQRGASAVIARAPRAAVDCNRSEQEVDPSVVEGSTGRPLTARARGGLGIVPARTQRHGYLWRRPIGRAELEDRLASAHRPYHQAIADELALLRDRFGCALLLDCHSMPPPSEGVAPIVFGDGYGRTAARSLLHAAQAVACRLGFDSGVNDPFAGGYIIEQHGDPARDVHAIQVEIDRRCYLDPTLRDPGLGFDEIARLFEALAVELGNLLLERRLPIAAE